MARLTPPDELAKVLEDFQMTIMGLDRDAQQDRFNENRQKAALNHKRELETQLLYCPQCKAPFPIAQPVDLRKCDNATCDDHKVLGLPEGVDEYTYIMMRTNAADIQQEKFASAHSKKTQAGVMNKKQQRSEDAKDDRVIKDKCKTAAIIYCKNVTATGYYTKAWMDNVLLFFAKGSAASRPTGPRLYAGTIQGRSHIS